jgi:hypothetical protein
MLQAKLRAMGVGVLLAAVFVSGCDTMKIEDFANRQPILKPEEYFLGQSRAWGMFHDRFGNLRRQFTVDMRGEMAEGVLTLTEDFLYDDGETQQRIWRITPLGNGRYEGRAGDVIGTAQGVAAGNALNWTYQMDLKVGDGTWRVGFDDWMFLQADGVLLNHATVTRWGIEIGVVTIAFQKGPAANALASGFEAQSLAQAAE